MRIRLARREDVESCLALDPSYITEQVWQVVEQTRRDETILSFRLSRLPRPLRVEYPRPLQDLAVDANADHCFLVAEEEGKLLGFADLTGAPWHRTAWLRHLVVLEPLRRQGIGTALLRAGLSWAEMNDLRTLTTECQTKNYPAIAFYRKNGLSFCGYNDRYYSNKDIALFFAYALKK